VCGSEQKRRQAAPYGVGHCCGRRRTKTALGRAVQRGALLRIPQTCYLTVLQSCGTIIVQFDYQNVHENQKGVMMSARSKTEQVRITVREGIVERAELAAEVLGVPSSTTLLGIAAGLGLRFMELAVIKPVAMTTQVQDAVRLTASAAVAEEVEDV